MRRPNGKGSVYKLKDTRRRRPWAARITVEWTMENGEVRQVRKAVGYFATKAEAMDALDEFNVDPWDIGNRSTFAELFKIWLDEKMSTGGGYGRPIGEKAVYSYRAAFKRCAQLHDREIGKISPAELQAVINESAGASKSTLNNILTVIKGVYEIAMRNNLIPKDRSQFITIPHKDVKNHGAFTKTEIRRIYSAYPCPEKDIVVLLIHTGWRISELLEMTRDNVDIDAMTFRGGKKTAAGKNRLVPIHPHIQHIVRMYYDRAGDGGLFVQDTKDKYQVNKVAASVNSFLKVITDGQRTAHSARACFATQCEVKGIPACVRDRLGGWSPKGNTAEKVYIDLDVDQLRAEVEKLDFGYADHLRRNSVQAEAV